MWFWLYIQSQNKEEFSMSKEKNGVCESSAKATPVVIWEHKKQKSEHTASKVVDLDAYRRSGTNKDESESTITNWLLPSLNQEHVVQLIMVSSGFGKGVKGLGSSTIQSMAA
jgi:hypothetical protein